MKVKFRDFLNFVSEKDYEDKDFTLSNNLKEVIKTLDIKSDVDKIISDIDSAKSVLLPPKSYAPDDKAYELRTPYGSKFFWKNSGSDLYKISTSTERDDSFYSVDAEFETLEQAERFLKNMLKESAILDLIHSLIYTGVQYGFGNREYTELGYRKQDVLKKNGFNGI